MSNYHELRYFEVSTHHVEGTYAKLQNAIRNCHRDYRKPPQVTIHNNKINTPVIY